MLSRKLIKYHYDPKNKKQWYKLRSELQGYGNPGVTRIGGSDIGVVLGLDRYRAPIELFYSLLNDHPSPHDYNEFTWRGTWQEEYLMKYCWRYFDPTNPSKEEWLENINANRYVRNAVRKNFTYINPDYPNIFINLDFQIQRSNVSKEGVLEMKSVSSQATDRWEAGVAPAYVAQTITQMFTSGHGYSELFQMKDSTYPDLYAFEKGSQTDSIFNNAVTEVDLFVGTVNEAKMHIANGMQGEEKQAMLAELEPEVTAGSNVTDFLKDRFKPEFIQEAEGSIGEAQLAKEYLEFGKTKKEAEEEQSLRKNKLLKAMVNKGANSLEFGELGRVSNFGRFSVSPKLITL